MCWNNMRKKMKAGTEGKRKRKGERKRGEE